MKHIVNFTVCEIIALNGTVINIVWLRKMDNERDLYFGQFVPNDTNFHLQVCIRWYIKFILKTYRIDIFSFFLIILLSGERFDKKWFCNKKNYNVGD